MLCGNPVAPHPELPWALRRLWSRTRRGPARELRACDLHPGGLCAHDGTLESAREKWSARARIRTV